MQRWADVALRQTKSIYVQLSTMITTTQIKFQATAQQVQQMEQNCQLTESLMAMTLARRIEGMKAEESIPYIESWFKSVRSMAQANFMLSGIKTEVTES